MQLESLKSQYEDQIAQLKGELEDTTRRTPDDPGGTTGPSAEEQEGAEGQTAPSPGPAALGQVCNIHPLPSFQIVTLVNSEKGVGIYKKVQFTFRSEIHLDISIISAPRIQNVINDKLKNESLGI